MASKRGKTYFSYLVNLVCVVLLFIVLTALMKAGVINTYWAGVIMLIMINIILATSLNLTTGVLGRLRLGMPALCRLRLCGRDFFHEDRRGGKAC